MKCIELSSFLRLFYKTDQLATGQPVIFHIWNDTGLALVEAESATEVGTEGVYYYDYTAPSNPQYLLIIGSNNGSDPEAQIIKVGEPSRKAFYVQGGFQAGKQINYEVYDSAGVTQDSGLLTDIVMGFYSADVASIPEPWFFEVSPWGIRNQPCIDPEG